MVLTSGARGVWVPARNRVDVESAVREIYDVHYARLAGWTASLVGDTDLAHDLATEAFLKLFREFRQRGRAAPVAVHRDRQPRARPLAQARPGGGRLPAPPGRARRRRPRPRPRHHPHRPRRRRWPCPTGCASSSCSTTSPTCPWPPWPGRSRSPRAPSSETCSTPASAWRRSWERPDDPRPPRGVLRARARATSASSHPLPDHWDSLVERSRRPARRSWVPYVAVAAAAAVVGGGARHRRPARATAPTASRQPRPAPRPRPPTPPSVPAPTSAATSSAPVASSTPVTTVPSGPLPVPASFDLVSMTNAGDGHLFAIGAATCPQGPCTSVVASEDDGRTWTARSTFDGPRAGGPARHPGRPRRGRRGALRHAAGRLRLRQHRPADDRRWAQLARRGRRPAHRALPRDRRVTRVDGDRACRCSHAEPDRGCSDLQPRTGSVGDDSTTAVALDGVPSHGDGAWVTLDGEDAYYNVTQPDGSPVPADAAVRHARRSCRCRRGAPTGMWVSGTASTPRHALRRLPQRGPAGRRSTRWPSRPTRGRRGAPATAPDLGRPGARRGLADRERRHPPGRGAGRAGVQHARTPRPRRGSSPAPTAAAAGAAARAAPSGTVRLGRRGGWPAGLRRRRREGLLGQPRLGGDLHRGAAAPVGGLPPVDVRART